MKDRYQQEIEQLLSELESEPVDPARAPTEATLPPDDQPSPFAPRPRQGQRLISPGKLALVGVLAALLGLLLPVMKWLALAGLAVAGAAILWMFIRRITSPPPQYAPGRPAEPAPQGAWQHFRRWLSR